MAAGNYYVALDQGTTSSRAILYSAAGSQLAVASVQLPIYYPQSGWVEQDANEIWSTQLTALQTVTKGISSSDIIALGVTNQRETIIAWDRESGAPLAPAIVWQCRRSAEICTRLKAAGKETLVRERTGLVLDPYFSATKILWLLENNQAVKNAADAGRAVFGTVDSWLVYQLTGKQRLVTEASNASRTMLCNLETAAWDDELLELFSLSAGNLPEILPSSGEFGTTSVLGSPIKISGILGDQQAALLGHACLQPGQGKCTFGTGAFMLMQTGDRIVHSQSGLLTTIAWRFGSELAYALEGSVFIAGALVQWLRDNLHLINHSNEIEALARSADSSGGVVIVPAFVGLGAPHWKPEVRGAIFGLTRDSGPAQIARASLEAVAHQVADMLAGPEFSSARTLGIDGGMSVNGLFCQILANLTGLSIELPPSPESTALGALRIAACGAGRYASLADACRELRGESNDSPSSTVAYTPHEAGTSELRNAWKQAIGRLL